MRPTNTHVVPTVEQRAMSAALVEETAITEYAKMARPPVICGAVHEMVAVVVVAVTYVMAGVPGVVGVVNVAVVAID